MSKSNKTVRVGNLAFTTTADGLKTICAEFGGVARVRVAESPLSGQSRGFAYVEMNSEAEAVSCIAGLHDQEREGRKLVVMGAPSDEVKRYMGRR